MAWSNLAPRRGLSPVGWLVGFALLVLPSAVLGVLALRTQLLALAVGAGVHVLFAVTLVRSQPVWRPPASATLIILYVISLAWLWLPTRDMSDWAIHAGQGVI